MIKRTCKQCGKSFTLTDSEIQFFKSKGLELPKRCSECRKNNRNNSNENSTETNKVNNSNRNNKNNNKKKNIFTCIIAALLVVVALFVGKVFNIDISSLGPNNSYTNEQNSNELQFRNEKLLDDHFEKHGDEFGYTTKEQYVEGANKVINSPTSLHKKEGEDGDDIYYDENNNEIVFVSGDGYIRTYFKPSEGINYYNRQ